VLLWFSEGISSGHGTMDCGCREKNARHEMKLVKIQHRGLQILWVIILSVIFIGFFKIVRGEDQETFENVRWLIRQQPNQLEVWSEAPEDFKTPAEPPKSPVDHRREWAEKAAGAEKVMGQKADEASPKAAMAPGKVQTIYLHLEEDRQHEGDIHFNIPGTETTIKISGFAVGSIIHDFDAIDSPSKFITSKIVVDGEPTGVSDSGTRFTAQQSRFIRFPFIGLF